VFHQRMLLERTREVESAMLYEVTRTVTSTLDLHQVLHLVSEGVLQALALERLWLFWREAPGGEVRGLEAARDGDGVHLQELQGNPASRHALLAAGPSVRPEVIAPGPAELAALGAVARPPERLLRLPLALRSARVGTIPAR